MPFFDQRPYDIRCEWGLPAIENLAAGDVIVVVDVLSFTTCVEIACSRGAAVLPFDRHDSSGQAYASEQGAVLAVKRGAARGEMSLSLSPESLMGVADGLRLVLPSPNGSTIAFAARSTNAVVLAGCLRNASAVARRANELGQRISAIPAGERWPDGSLRPAIEDWYAAGAIIAQCRGRRSPEAAFAAAAAGLIPIDQLEDCSSARELRERGYGGDVELAFQQNVSDVVPRLVGNAFIADNG